MATGERINLAHCFHELFGVDERSTEAKRSAAQTGLRGFRKKFNDAAGSVGCPVRFEVDSDKRARSVQRYCWFSGPDLAVSNVEDFTRESIADIAGDVIIPPRAIASTAQAIVQGKCVVRFFVSYAHTDRTLADDFLRRFRSEFDAARHYKLDLYIDRRINTGDQWKAEILKALGECEFGLLLVTREFLNSEFITEHELPVFVPRIPGSGAKPVVPVGLKVIDFEHQDLKGLEHTQIFRRTTGRNESRFYSECGGDRAKDDFAHHLFLDVCKKLDEHFGPPPPSSKAAAPALKARRMERGEADEENEASPPADPIRQFDDHLRKWAKPEADCFIRTLARPTSFDEMERLDGKVEAGDGRDALEDLHAWARTPVPDAPVFCAVLGEYGIGKTTTLKKFAEELLDRRMSDASVPLPIYIDLRLRLGSPKEVPTLEELLAEVIRRNHHLSTASPLTPAEIIRLVRHEGAVILFDGLDEKIVHLPTAEAQAYIRVLWNILPPSIRKADLQPGQRLGKLLISCRSHYFRDVLSQTSMLKGEDREGLRSSDYKVLLMLPFSEMQIRAYLRDVTGSDERADEAFALIQRTHNLLDLAERPVLLHHITDHLDELERAAIRGEPVNAAFLYQRVVENWLNRDNGKHQLNPMHKRILMERLAGHLAAQGARELSADDLDAWLDQFLYDEPVIANAYPALHRDVLKEDLRTATFVVRPESGGASAEFRFAHTSLQEFFLASHLHRALREGKAERWALPPQTVETLDFIGQLLQLKTEPAAIRTWESILGGSVLPAAVLAFRLWIRARDRDYPQPQPPHVNLEGADLDNVVIGFSRSRPRQSSRSPSITSHHSPHSTAAVLNLRSANLRRVRLNRSRLECIDLTDADLTGAEMRQALCLDVTADRAILDDADLDGSQWSGCSLRGAKAATARLNADFIHTDLSAALLPAEWSSVAANSGRSSSVVPQADARASALLASVGHSSRVSCCAWSPDGQQLLSGSYDHTLKVWDAHSGCCLWTGHPLPEGEIATFDADHDLQTCTPEAWRFLGWRWLDPTTNRLRLLPAEHFGPLPVVDPPERVSPS
ncbi:MAG: pentapeptide repeat-containing protein [Verrucomicrobiaceae bacterium]|nr:pentapeptide repeat-containing protein [Verrucomicrobiaceae bacterium]